LGYGGEGVVAFAELIHAASGNRAEALRTYARLKALLEAEPGTSPVLKPAVSSKRSPESAPVKY
jgi:DNA-binding SARP family transcriptional activator